MTPPDRPRDRAPEPMLHTLRLVDAGAADGTLRRAVTAPHRPSLAVLSGKHIGERHRIERSLVIGRNPAADVVLTDDGVSWLHARIEDRGDTWGLVDLNSTNGTSVNGRVGRDFTLAQGDKIVFGRVVVRFELLDLHEQAYDDLVQHLLSIDDLSGLFVRRKFDAELALMVAAARVSGERVGLLVMDLDGVKKINDTHGHLFGAYTIGESGKVIGRVIEGRGIGARFGGDEYVVALPGLELEAAAAVGEEIRLALSAHPFSHEGVALRPGISIGVASLPESGTTPTELFSKADQALYRAKAAGKNRVCM